MKHGTDASFEDRLRHARLAQAAHLDALTGVRDAELLRLQALRDDLAAVVSRDSRLEGLADLALIPDDPPKLWIDLVTHVVMAPDPRSYCLVEDCATGRESVFSSRDRSDEKVCGNRATIDDQSLDIHRPLCCSLGCLDCA